MTKAPSYALTKSRLIEEIKRRGGWLEKVETGPLVNGVHVKTYVFEFIVDRKTKVKRLCSIELTNWQGNKFVSEVYGDVLEVVDMEGSWFYDASDRLIEPGNVRAKSVARK